jgi:hypothetical protein
MIPGCNQSTVGDRLAGSAGGIPELVGLSRSHAKIPGEGG